MVFGIAIGMLIGVSVRRVKRGAALFALMVCVVVAEIGTRIHLDPLIVMLAAGIWLRNFSRADAHAAARQLRVARSCRCSSCSSRSPAAKLDIFTLWASIAPGR